MNFASNAPIEQRENYNKRSIHGKQPPNISKILEKIKKPSTQKALQEFISDLSSGEIVLSSPKCIPHSPAILKSVPQV